MASDATPRLVLPLHQFSLENGLRVILHADRSAPLVTVNLWYHVGSKNERPGRTGFAHLFEHMLFQGSANVADDQHFALIQQRGGTANGSTWFDRTNYFATLPAHELELGLWLESDRMGFLLEGLTQEKLESQRQVVKNERRFRVDNQPYGTWLEKGLERLFPPTHPYHWPVIGYMADLDAADLEDVRGFFRTYYVPNNAVLTVAGDIEVARAEELVRRYFTDIPRGAEVPRVDARYIAAGREQRLVVEDRVELPRVFGLYAIPPYGTRGYYALDFAADLLASGKSCRLYRRLVHERELAKDVSAFTFNTEEVGMWIVSATPRPGVAVETLLEAVDAELELLCREPAPAAEWQRLLNRIDTAFVARFESTEKKADLLSMHATYFGDPLHASQEIERYRSIDPEELCAAAREHLDPGRRVLLTYVPRAPARESVAVTAPLRRDLVPRSDHARAYHLPRPQRARLGNGLSIVVSRVSKVPTVVAAAVIDAGSVRDPQGREGLAELSSALLDEGTARRASMEIAEALETLGAALGSSAEVDSASLELSVLSRNFPDAWSIAAELLVEPSFPAREVERVRQEHLAHLLEERASPGAVADDALEILLYGAHPYAHPVHGNEESLGRIDVEDVRRFAATYLRPERTTLLVVGDIDPDRSLAEIERTLGGWTPGGDAPIAIAEPVAVPGRRIFLVDRPGAAQSELRLANLALRRADPDWIAAEVMNGVFGGKFTSRINLNLRERHGYTYGAHSGFARRRARGPFLISTAVETKVTVPALRELFGEIELLRGEPITPAELADTRSYLEGVFPLTVETSSDVLARLAELVLYGLPDDWFDRYRERVAAVTAEDVQRAALDRVLPDQMVVLVVGDAGQVAGELESLGPVTRVDERGRPV